ncbi:MAG: relaxase/mobilization nuclease domain-containing protein [Ginsengibacter sp.]
MSLNERTSCNTIHISLNFDSSEKLDVEKLQSIAIKRMEMPGFCNQSYLL